MAIAKGLTKTFLSSSYLRLAHYIAFSIRRKASAEGRGRREGELNSFGRILEVNKEMGLFLKENGRPTDDPNDLDGLQALRVPGGEDLLRRD